MNQHETLARLAGHIDALNDRIGRGVAWLTFFLVAITFLLVILRYFFDLNWIWMQELATWMHALIFLLAAAYTLYREEHVRVDVFYRKAGPRRRALTDLLGFAFLLAPVCLFLVWVSWPYVFDSWAGSEGSREAGGLPFPFVPLAKTCMPLMAVLVLLQGLAGALRAGLLLGGHIDAPAAGYGQRAPQGGEL